MPSILTPSSGWRRQRRDPGSLRLGAGSLTRRTVARRPQMPNRSRAACWPQMANRSRAACWPQMPNRSRAACW